MWSLCCRFLDLHELHEAYLNLPEVARVDYKTFLDVFPQFDALPDKAKASPAFKQYLGDLARYLGSFITRSQPLVVSLAPFFCPSRLP